MGGESKTIVAVAVFLAVLAAACRPSETAPAPAPSGAAPPAKSEPAPKAEPQPVGPLKKVRLAYSAPTAVQSVLWVAKDAGLFEKYGLDPEVVEIPTNSQIAAVIAGEVNLGITSGDSLASAILSGSDLVMISSYIPTIQMNLYSRPEINSGADLKGKVVGASTAGPGIARTAAETSLRRLGLDPEKDVEWRVFPNTATAQQALIAGGIDALAIAPPDTIVARKNGLKILYDIVADKVPYPAASSYLTRQYASQNPEVPLAYMKAMLESIKFYQTDAEFPVKTFLKWTNQEDREIGEEAIAYMGRAMPRVPKWTEEGMRVILGVLALSRPDASTADPKSFFDNRYVEELERTGFIDRLWAGR